jgi:hypothetical protein
MKAWCELREAWHALKGAWRWAKITDAEFVKRAEQIGRGQQARQLVTEDVAMP